MSKKGLMLWSGGKDSAAALYKARQSGIDVTHLITFLYNTTEINSIEPTVYSSGLPKSVIQAQADAIGCQLVTLELPTVFDFTNALLYDKLSDIKNNYGITHYISGEGAEPTMSIWHSMVSRQMGFVDLLPNSHLLDNVENEADFIINSGFKNLVVGANDQYVTEDILGREYDADFREYLNSTLNKHGERTHIISAYGEFHTFCYDGPIFNSPVNWDYDKTITVDTPFHDEHNQRVDYKTHFYLVNLADT
jgi:diphthamide synthase (EF-2-diphthine--ammonia ligase)